MKHMTNLNLDISGKNISRIENLKEGLEKFNCSYNSISKIEDLPESLEKFICSFNKISKIENLPQGLLGFRCWKNNISKIENLPLGLRIFLFSKEDIKFVDNVSIDKIRFTLKGYNAIKKFQLRIKRRYKRAQAARVIQTGLYNWLWKPEGIVARIETRNLRETLGMFQ